MLVALKGRTALVMGASSGIGRATAVLLAREGVRVMAAARREDRLRSLAEEVPGLEYCLADAARAEDSDRAAALTVKLFGKVDILVYATGTNTPDRSMRRLTQEIWDTTVEVNLSGAYYATRSVLPGMRAAGSGYVIYISSISGMVPDVSGAAYQAAKRGLLGLAHAVRVEEKEHGIRTCVICPGLVDSEMLNLRPVKTPAETVAKAMQPEDIAEVVLAVARLHPRVVVPEMQVLPTYL
jgi:NADP-dependent 3-hydroxy acid dehydrogenase YdfG